MLKTSLKYFGRAVQLGSIRAASESLNVAQSAVSRQIQALEHEFGSPLLERHARGIMLTPSGEVLYRYFREVSFQIERVHSEIDEIQGLRRGHVKVCCLESLAHDLIPRAIERFRVKHPGVTFEIHTAPAIKTVRYVRDGDVEIGVTFNAPVSPELRSVFRRPDRLLAVMRPDHRLGRSRMLSLAHIAGWPIAMPRRASGSRELIDAACSRAGVNLAPVIETNSVELLHNFAANGHGISILSRVSCHEGLLKKRFVGVPLTDELLNSGAVEILTLSSRRLPLAAEEFIVTLRVEFDRITAKG